MARISPEILADIASIVTKSIRLGAKAQPKWCCFLGIYGLDKVEKRLEFVSMPGAIEEPGQLLRVYVNGNDSVARMLFEPLIVHLAPFSICGAHAAFKQTADGFVVFLSDAGQLNGDGPVHEATPA